jgi:hypothetical protein
VTRTTFTSDAAFERFLDQTPIEKGFFDQNEFDQSLLKDSCGGVSLVAETAQRARPGVRAPLAQTRELTRAHRLDAP